MRRTLARAYAARVDHIGPDSDLALNQAVWAAVNEQFTDADADRRWTQPEITWGLFSVPEQRLQVIGDVAACRVLDLACGTGYFAAWLTRGHAEVTALDFSPEQLRTALRCQRQYGPTFPLLRADAQRLPFPTGSFDLVVSEHGAPSWCDPRRWVPEVARVLVPDGRLVFLTNSVLAALCVPEEGGPAGERLLRGQRDVARVRWPGGGVEFHPSHGQWIATLRDSGFEVSALHEVYPREDAADHAWYQIVSAQWASNWPAEELWVASLRR